ncbi:MAG TPA: D-inositol-3-phosphate glycosyltransferase [Actinomycetales bacterium]|nr:D-inositol-3-phosphate glycosyltransferase [Actinomycetales bacterium]
MGLPGRVAMLAVHTSPLEQPGTGDAGGMNVYVVETARRLARRGVDVEVFTRATSSQQPRVVEMEPGVLVRHVPAGPFEGLSKEDLPGQLCAFAAGVLRAEASRPPGWYDVVHSHYWLSGQVGWLAAERWQVPLVHTMHTMARVKNLSLADGDTAEPAGREIGEAQVVEAADRLVANTDEERDQLVALYGADRERVAVVPPGVDLDRFTPVPQAGRRAARESLGIAPDANLLLFVGRIQPLKAPDVLVRATARLLDRRPDLRPSLVVAVVGGPSGSGLREPESLARLVADLGLGDVVRFAPPAAADRLVDWYRAADLVAVPSYSESFGLVALEAQACGTPVVAAAVGGLRETVADGVSGVLVPDHEPGMWADAVASLLDDAPRRRRLSAGAVRHAARYGWDATVDGLLEVYAQARSTPRRLEVLPPPAAVDLQP